MTVRRKVKAKKPKLLKAAEARKLVDELAAKTAEMGLALHNKDLLLKSMTGARDNCKTMYEHELNLRMERDAEVKILKAAIKEREGIIGQLNQSIFQRDEKLRAYSGESAGSLIKRGLGLFFRNVGKSLRKLLGKI